MALTVELFGGPKDGETRAVDHVVAVLSFPAIEQNADGSPKIHRYEWRATAIPSGYYYAGLVRC